MSFFLSQFKQPKIDDFDVYVPLGRAQRHASVVAVHEKSLGNDAGETPDLKAIEAGEDGDHVGSAYTLQGLKAEIDLDIAASGHDTMYDRKSKVINKAIQDIGMGPYQWKLFGLCGFGWLADNMWLQGVALTLPQLTAEFGPDATQVRYTTCATFIGLCIGASFWGVASDVIGRRLAFNTTLFIAGVFGLAVGGGNSWIESPKFLLSRGRQEDAVATVYGIAHANQRTTWLTVEVLNEVGGYPEEGREVKLSTSEIIQRFFSKFSTERIGPLFGTKRLGTMTALIWICWATIGMGYPLFNAFLPQYLQNAGKDQPLTPTSVVYRNYAITSIIGVPGSIIAAYTVDIKYIGRKYTIAISTLLTGIILFLFTISSKPDFQLAMTSLEAFFQNIMYGVLYA
ncbi:MAG: hypothetical protein Q9195_000766 [Heterodermia aff. obscurata]